MKYLYILRHAKASWPPGTDDFDRPLAEEAHAHLEQVLQHMKENGYAPDNIICSPALRTRQTLSALLNALDINPMISYPEDLYGAGAGDIYKMITEVSGGCGSLMVVGHNPAIHQIATFLADGSSDKLKFIQRDYSAGTLSLLECDIDEWSELMPAQNSLRDVVIPQDIT